MKNLLLLITITLLLCSCTTMYKINGNKLIKYNVSNDSVNASIITSDTITLKSKKK